MMEDGDDRVREGAGGRFDALLVDAGGTLFPDALPPHPGVREVRLRRMAAALPELAPEEVARLLAEIEADALAARDRLDQGTDADIAERLRAAGPALASRTG